VGLRPLITPTIGGNCPPITPKSKKQTAYGVRLKIENIKRIKTTEEVKASSSR